MREEDRLNIAENIANMSQGETLFWIMFAGFLVGWLLQGRYVRKSVELLATAPSALTYKRQLKNEKEAFVKFRRKFKKAALDAETTVEEDRVNRNNIPSGDFDKAIVEFGDKYGHKNAENVMRYLARKKERNVRSYKKYRGAKKKHFELKRCVLGVTPAAEMFMMDEYWVSYYYYLWRLDKEPNEKYRNKIQKMVEKNPFMKFADIYGRTYSEHTIGNPFRIVVNHHFDDAYALAENQVMDNIKYAKNLKERLQWHS